MSGSIFGLEYSDKLQWDDSTFMTPQRIRTRRLEMNDKPPLFELQDQDGRVHQATKLPKNVSK